MDGHVDQWNRIESLEINLHIYSQLIFDSDAKTAQWGNGLFQHMVLGQLDINMQKK